MVRGANDALDGIVIYYDDFYDTRTALLRPGESLGFDQWNWGHFFVGVPGDGDPTGSFELDVTSGSGGSEGRVTLSAEAGLVDPNQAFRRIDVNPHHRYTLRLSGSMTREGNGGGDIIDGVVVYYDNSYDTRTSFLRPGESVTFTQRNWGFFFVGVPGNGTITGSFIVDVESTTGTNTQVVLDASSVTRVDG